MLYDSKYFFSIYTHTPNTQNYLDYVYGDILVCIITQTEVMKYKIILNKNRKDILTLEKQLLN